MVLPEPSDHQADWALEYSKQLKIKDEQHAFSLIDRRHGMADRGTDPLLYAMHQQWYVGIRHLLNLGENSGDIGLFSSMDRNRLPSDSVYAANHLLPNVMKQVARLAGVAEKFEVTPKSTDPDDIFAARLSQSLLDHENEQCQWSQIKLEAVFWAVTCGAAIIQTEWDMSRGKLLTTYKNPIDGREVPTDQADGGMVKMMRDHGSLNEKRTGELSMRTVSPFELTIPRGVRSLEQCPWIILEEEVDPAYVWDRWPKKAGELTPDDFSADVDSVLWKRLRREATRFGHSIGTSGAEASEVVTIRSMWVPPGGWCPTGYVIYATRNTLLGYDEHPYFKAGFDPREKEFSHFRYPISKSDYSPVFSRFWGMGLLENLIGPQQQYNQSIDQLMRQRDRFGSPTWLAPRDSELSVEGDVWEYSNQGGKPEQVAPPPMGGSQIEAAQIALSDMRVISSQSDPGQDYPSGIRSGSGITQIQEGDNMAMGPALIGLSGLYRDTQNRILGLNWKFAQTERLISIYGEERASDAVVFKGSQLNGNIFVRIDPSSMRLESRAAAMELVTMMGQIGALNPGDPAHLESIHNALEFRDGKEIFKGVNLQKRRADHEESLFMRMTGQEGGIQAPWPDVNDYDDHMVHIQSHTMFLATDTFERWPLVKQLAFQAHIRKHEAIVAQIMMAQQSMSAQQPGGGGSPPAPVGEASQPRQSPQQQPSNQGQGSFA